MTKPIKSIDCALLVVSCDAYSDLWTPFFTLLNRHWPDRPFPLYLGAGELTYPNPAVHMLRSNAGRDWSQCVIDYLDHLPHRHVLIMLDDFFLRRQVPTSEILYCLEFACTTHSTQLRLIPRPRPTNRLHGEKWIGSSEAGSPYRLSTQAAIWDRAKLRDLLRPGESIWEFEQKGNARAALQAGGFYSVKSPVLPYEGFWAHHVVEKGKWLPHEKRIFARQNIGCDFSKRGTLPWTQVAFLNLVQITDRALRVLPWRTNLRVKRVLKSILRPFFRNAMDRLGQTPSASRLIS